MNRYATYLAGGALLASTALASGTVQAASVRFAGQTGVSLGTLNDGAGGGTIPTSTQSATKELSTTLFGGTAANNSSLNVSLNYVIVGSNNYSPSSTTMQINITGGEFGTTAPVVRTLTADTTGSISQATAMGSGILVFSDHIILTTIPNSYTAIEVVSPTGGFTNLQGLATASANVSLSGTIFNAAQTATFENITSKNILTGRTPLSFGFTSDGTTASNSTTPAFANFGSSTALTLQAGTFGITQVTGYSTDLATLLTGMTSISTMEVRITHASLADSAFDSVYLSTSPGGAAMFTAKSAGSIASGVATFTLVNANNTFNNDTVVNVNIKFTGTSTISATTGTQSITLSPTNLGKIIAPAAATGSLGNVSRGGLSSTVNTFQNSFNTIPSLLRITNGSVNAGTYTIVVRSGDASSSNAGAILGTYTGGTIAPNSTLQLAPSTIETGASIAAPTTFGNYTLAVTATFSGYIQHLTFGNGIVSNLSAFRNGGTSGGTTP